MDTSSRQINRLFHPWHLGNDGTLYGMCSIGLSRQAWCHAGLVLARFRNVVVDCRHCQFFKKDRVVLGAQAYIAAFHMGGVFYPSQLVHHPLVGCAPGIFAFFAFNITVIRTNSVLVAFGWILACTDIAFVLSRILVTLPPPSDDKDQQGTNILGGGENNHVYQAYHFQGLQ